MELHRMMKTDARRALKTCWGKSLGAAAVLLATYLAVVGAEAVLLFVFSENTAALCFLSLANAGLPAIVITAAAAFAFILLMPALCLGYKKLHLSFAAGKAENVSVIFDMFSSFKLLIKSIVFTVALAVRCALCAAVACFPGGALFYLARNYIVSEDRTIVLLKISACCVSVILIILCLVLAFIFSQRWFLAGYYLASGRKIHEAFKLSVKATKNERSHIAGFRLSFIGWWLLSLFLLPLLWVIPYRSVACAIYANYLMSKLEHVPAEQAFDITELDPEPEFETEHEPVPEPIPAPETKPEPEFKADPAPKTEI